MTGLGGSIVKDSFCWSIAKQFPFSLVLLDSLSGPTALQPKRTPAAMARSISTRANSGFVPAVRYSVVGDLRITGNSAVRQCADEAVINQGRAAGRIQKNTGGL